jgi:phage gpG-like protein
MANVQYKFDRSALKKIRDTLKGCETSLADCEELFVDIRNDVFIPSARKTFDAEGRPTSWPALSEAYALAKARKVGHTRILVWSESLMDSVASESGTEFSVWEEGPRRMIFGTERPWASVHQEGGGNVPARPFIVVQDEDHETILDMSVEWLMKEGRYEE